MAFARCKWSGYTKLGKMDFQHPVCAAKICFRFVSCLENIIVHRKLLMPHAFAFCLFFPKRTTFADIHRNVALIHSVMIRQSRISNCNKPVITWPLSHLADLPFSGTSHPHAHGHVITSTSASTLTIMFFIAEELYCYISKEITMQQNG